MSLDFSVVIPLYNKSEHIEKTIHSALSQVDVSIEVVVVNDGSTDDSPSIVERIDDPRVRLINQENGGVSSARNRGCNESRSEVIAFLDADDTWHRQHLANLKQLVDQHLGAGVFGAAFRQFRSANQIEPDLQKTHDLKAAKIETVDVENYARRACAGSQPFWTSASAVKKTAFLETGGFNEDFSHGEDVAVWLAIAAKQGGVTSSLVTAFYHIGDANSLTGKLVKADGTIDLVEKLLTDQSWTKSQSDALKAISDRFALSHAASAIGTFGNRTTCFQFLNSAYKKNGKWLKLWIAACLPRFVVKALMPSSE